MADVSSLFASVPLGFLLGVLAFLLYWVNAFFILYHLVRFGIGVQPKILGLIFFLGAVVLFAVTVALGSRVDLAAALGGLEQNTRNLLPRY